MELNKLKHSRKDPCATAYEKEVEDVLTELNLNNDSLDRSDFDVVAYINEMFPTEQSLANIDEAIAETEKKILELDTETRDIVRGRWQCEDEGQEVVQEAMQMIQSLFVRIRDVQDRATRSEEMVHEITKDIQQLDQAKRNLTVSITTLNNLILIVNALDRLNTMLGISTKTESKKESSTRSSTTSKSTKATSNPFVENEVAREANKSAPQGSANNDEQLSLPLVTEVSNLLAQVQRLMQPMMTAYGSVPSVSGLSHELDTIHNVLASQLVKELKNLLTRSRNITDQAPLIQAACQLMELLPESLQVKSQILDWFILRQLGEYKELFEPSQTSAWLDKIDHRYDWLRSNLPPLERKLQVLFPAEWHVSEQFVMEFCRITKADLEVVMKRRQAELNHNLIIFGLQRTLAFEASLNKIYSTSKVTETNSKENFVHDVRPAVGGPSLNPFDEDGNETSEVGLSSTGKQHLSGETSKAPGGKPEGNLNHGEAEEQWKKQPFDGIISSCFDAHFDLYLNHVEKALREQLQSRFIGDFTVNKSTLMHRDLGDVFKDDSPNLASMSSPDPGENTLSSATELFLLYKQVVKQTLQLNRGKGLLGLVRLLRQYLSEYNVWVLLSQIPGFSIGAPTAPAGSSATGFFAPDMASKMAAFGLSGLSALGINRSQSLAGSDSGKVPSSNSLPSLEHSGVNTNQLFANLMKDDSQLARLTKDDIHKVCVVLVTAAFCLKTVEELEKRLKMEVRPPSWSSEISFSAEIDGFAACRSACVHRLVSDLEAAAEPHLVTMARLPWNNLVHVGDQSIFITEIIKHLRTQVPLIRDTLYSVRATFTQICIKFAGALITRFIASLYRCKPVNTFGAEQLLLDTQSLKSALIQMPVFGAKFSQAPPRSFTNLVHEGMGRAERIIKAVMLPVGTPPASGQPNPTEPGFASSTSFVMGPIDTHAAEVFLASYKQLLPDASPTDLQKVLEMKGVKYNELQLIVDIFHGQLEASRDSKANGALDTSEPQSDAKKDETELKNPPGDQTACDGDSSNSRSAMNTENQPQGSRIKPLEKLVKKKR